MSIIDGASVLLLPSPGQIVMPLSMEVRLYLGKKNNLNLLLDGTQDLLHDQNVGSDKLDEARGDLEVYADAFFAAYNGLSRSQRRKTRDEQSHIYYCVNGCMQDLCDAILLKRQREKQVEAERVRQEKLAEAE